MLTQPPHLSNTPMEARLHTPMQIYHVLIVGDQTLFEEGISKVLSNDPDLSITCASYTDDVSFLELINRTKPDVIMLNESSSLDLLHILEFLLFYPILENISVIVFRLESNVVDVIDLPRRVQVKKSADFKSLIMETSIHPRE